MSGRHERDIHREIVGREIEVLQALGIHPQRTGHQHCPLPLHEDRRPSWRWDASKARWYCSCGSGTVIDAVMQVLGLDAREAIRWVRATVLGDDQVPQPRPRPAPPPPNDDAEQQQKHRLQEKVAAHATTVWERSAPANPDHPYLRWKRVLPHELRQHGSTLLVPLYSLDGQLWNLQTIDEIGEGQFRKLYLKGGRAGGVFSSIGLTEPPERIVICEGFSTGATIFEKAGLPVMAAMSAGNLMAMAKAAREAWPEADIIIAADNDRHTRGNPGLTKATLAAIATGARLAVPQFPEGADPKASDFNDLHRLEPGAVAAAIEAAERIEPPAPPARRGFMTAETASEALRSAVDAFFDEALRPPPQDVPGVLDLNSYEPFHAIRAPAGLGKSRAVMRRLTGPALAEKHVVYAVPTVELAHELKAHYDAMAGPNSPRMLVILGREQVRPDGVRMCAKHRTAAAVAHTGNSVQTTLCKRELRGKEAAEKGARHEFCPHFHTCPYQRQIEDKEPAVRVVPHARLFLPGRKDEERAPDIVIIDESFHNTALRGAVRLREDITETPQDDRAGYSVVLDRMAGEGRGVMSVPRQDGKGEDHDATADLDVISARTAHALYRGGRLADFQAEGVTEEAAGIARNLAFRCVERLGVTPSMADEIQDERIKFYKAQEALRLARLFKLLKESLAAGIDPRCFTLIRNVPTRGGGREDRCFMRWSEDLRIGGAAVLMIDADFDEQVARRFMPKLAKVTEIEAEPVNYHATQAIDRRVSMDMLCVSFDVRKKIAEHGAIPAKLSKKDRTRINNCKRLHRLAEVKAVGGRKGLIVSYKAVEEVLRALPPIEGVEYGHFSALRGVDRWKDVDFLIEAGAPQLNETDLEMATEALWYLSPKPIRRIEPDAKGERRYTREPQRIEMADGGSAVVSIDTHPDERCQRLLDLIRREVGQGVGRMRLIHRKPDRPCEILIFTNTPIAELPIHRTTTWQAATDVSLLDLLMARGLIPEAWRDAETLLSDVIESERGHPGEATRRAFERAELPGLADLVAARLSDKRLYKSYYRRLSETHPFRFRVRGRRQSARILIDLNRHPDPKAALERALGPLDRFEALEAAAVRAADEALAAAPPPAPVEPAHPPPADVIASEPSQPQLPPPEPMPVGAVAETDEFSDLVASPPSQPPALMPEPVPEPAPALVAELEVPQVSEPTLDAEPEVAASPALEPMTSSLFGFGIDVDEDADDPWCGWPGPSPSDLRRHASLPRLVVANISEPPEELSDAELVQLLAPKRPIDTAVGWEIRAHDALRELRVPWLRAQRLVKQESAAHDWRAHCPVRLAPIRDSP